VRKKKRTFKRFVFIAAVLAIAGAALFFLVSPVQISSGPAKIYLFKGSKLVYVERQVPNGAKELFFVAEELLRAPSATEKQQGYFSQIPQQTKLRNVYKRGDTVLADFSKDLETYGGGTSKVQGLLAQIVYTFTDLPGIKKVQILVDGATESALGSEGYVIDKPLIRKDVKF